MKILIVDDQAVYRSTLKMLLEQQFSPVQVEEAYNGEECLQRIETKDFDLILMDIQMPGMNGIEATRQLQEKHPDLKVLGMSMFASIQDVEAMKAAGASGFFDKELSVEHLFEAISTIDKEGTYFDY